MEKVTSDKKKRAIIANGRASICDWSLQVTFRTKEQCREFMQKYMTREIPLSVQYFQEDEDHIMQLNGCWAHNLTVAAKMLEEVDYNDE